MLLILSLLVLSATLVQPQSKDSADRFASLELQLNEMRSAQLALTNQVKVLVNEIKYRKSTQLDNPSGSTDDEKPLPSDIKYIEAIKTELMSKLYFIKRKVKHNYEHKNSKGKMMRVNAYDLKERLDKFEKVMQNDKAELAQQLRDSITSQNDRDKKVKELAQKFKDTTMNISVIQKEVSEHAQHLKNIKSNQNDRDKEVKELAQKFNDTTMNIALQINDTIMNISVLQNEIAELAQQSNYTKTNQNDSIGRLKTIESQLSILTRRMLPPHLSKLVGTRIPGWRSSLGPLSSASLTGSWEWRRNEGLSQKKTDRKWSEMLKGRSDSVLSGPIILPWTPHFIGRFRIEGYSGNEMNIYFFCYTGKHIHNLTSYLPFKFKVRIRIQDQGFTEIQNCSFQVTKLGSSIKSPNLIPINKNWNKNKLPVDIEFLFL